LNTSTLSRRTLPWLFLLPSAYATGVMAAARDPSAEAFVDATARRLLGVLADPGLSPAAKSTAFRSAIDTLADVPRVTSFVLGKYARLLTPDQKRRFALAFRGYVEHVYRARLSDYGGERVSVVGSIVRKPGDVIVATQISGGQLRQAVPVSWRVLRSPQGWRLVDVQFRGVWLAITQQQDFVSTIDNAGGDVEPLIRQLQADAAPAPSKR
jgi:phospholipid transport system substrate-binding protein